MQALLYLIDTNDNAHRAVTLCASKQLTISHRTHEVALDEDIIRQGGFSINFGGYGSYSRVGLGATFHNRWKIADLDEARQQPFAQLVVYFAGNKWIRPLNEQMALVNQGGGSVTDDVNCANIVVTAEKDSSELPTLPETTLVVGEMVFQRALPATRKGPSSKSPRSKALTGEAAALWKLLSMRDEASIRQGLNLAFGLEEAIEELLAGTEVHAETGALIRNKRFSGSGVAQPFLDAALYGLLSCAAEGSMAAQLRASIRKIDIGLPFLPELSGFEAVNDLTLKLEDPFHAQDLQNLGPMPHLRRLTIVPKKEERGYWGDWPVLSSLDGLDAPALEQVTINKTDLKNCHALLACPRLCSVDLSQNRRLSDIDGLASCLANLIDLSLEECEELTSLKPITGAAHLEKLILCGSGITTLQPLMGSPNIQVLEIDHCTQLASLQGLEHLTLGSKRGGTFSLTGCDALTSLEGFPKLDASYDGLDVSNLSELQQLNGIQQAPHITNLNASGTAISDVNALAALSMLQELDLSSCESLTDISGLTNLEHLQAIDLSDCTALQSLPDHWASSPEGLNLQNCSALRSLGTLPTSLSRIGRYSWRSATLGLEGLAALESLEPLHKTALGNTVTEVDLSGCTRLTSLAGLEGMSKLEKITLPVFITDVSALTHCRSLEVNIDATDTQSLPAPLAQALAILPRLSLGIESGYQVEDASALAHLRQVEVLDLRSCNQLQDLGWLIGLSELRELKLNSLSPASQYTKNNKPDSQVRVRKLQQQLCTDLKLPLPAHLSSSMPNKKGPAKRQAGALSLKELKPLLTSAQWGDVSQGLQRLTDVGDASLYDELVEDCDPTQAFSGDSLAIGKLFKAVKAANRPLARWALVCILAQAPEEASQAAAVRTALRGIDLDFKDWGDAAQMPPLHGFSALEKIRFSAYPSTSLLALTGLDELRELDINGAPQLTTLQGLESAHALQSLSLRDCPQLVDLSALAGKNGLQQQGNLDLSTAAPLEKLDFFSQVELPESLELLVTPLTDLSPLHNKPSVTTLSLYCTGEALPDLSPLIHIQKLQYYREKPPTAKQSNNVWPFTQTEEEDNTPPPLLHWAVNLPQLNTLDLNGGAHDLSGLVAPHLKTFQSWGRWAQGTTLLANLRGLSSVEDFTFYSTSITSLDGLQGCPVTELNLGSLEGSLEDLSALREMPALRTLTLPSGTDVLKTKALQSLLGLTWIEHLSLQNYAGSLTFLAGWDGLRTLDLQQSGALIDLETLIALPSLETVLLRGAYLKRNAWPEALQSKLEYVRSS